MANAITFTTRRRHEDRNGLVSYFFKLAVVHDTAGATDHVLVDPDGLNGLEFLRGRALYDVSAIDVAGDATATFRFIWTADFPGAANLGLAISATPPAVSTAGNQGNIMLPAIYGTSTATMDTLHAETASPMHINPSLVGDTDNDTNFKFRLHGADNTGTFNSITLDVIAMLVFRDIGY